MRWWGILLFALLVFPLPAHAGTAQDDARARKLFTEVRCVACQGQDIGDSDAAIAADMRNEIREAIKAGRSDAEIRQTLYTHYGDYVLFRPRLSRANAVLWGLPPLIILFGVAAGLWLMRRQGAQRSYALTEAEEARLRELTSPDADTKGE